MDESNRLTDAEVRDLREFVETLMALCEGNPDLEVEIGELTLTAAEILGILDNEDGEDD